MVPTLAEAAQASDGGSGIAFAVLLTLAVGRASGSLTPTRLGADPESLFTPILGQVPMLAVAV